MEIAKDAWELNALTQKMVHVGCKAAPKQGVCELLNTGSYPEVVMYSVPKVQIEDVYMSVVMRLSERLFYQKGGSKAMGRFRLSQKQTRIVLKRTEAEFNEYSKRVFRPGRKQMFGDGSGIWLIG